MGKIMNIDKLNIVKRDKIVNGLNYVEEINNIEPIIEKIIIFGSSITDECSDNSDIDVCIVSKYNNSHNLYKLFRGRFMDKIDDVCDIIKYDRLNERFKAVVDAGVVVYEI